MKRLAFLLILLAVPAAAEIVEPHSTQIQVVYDVTAILNGMAQTPAGLAEVKEILRPKDNAVVILH